MSRIDPELFKNGVRFHVHESKPDRVPDVNRTDTVEFAGISQLPLFPTDKPWDYAATVAFWLAPAQSWLAYVLTSYQELSGGTNVNEENVHGPYQFSLPPPSMAEVTDAERKERLVEVQIWEFGEGKVDLFRDRAELTEFAPIVLDCTREVKAYFARHPERLHDLEPRRFEILVADILRDFGFETELTSITRDKGRDIYAYLRSAIASFLLFVECKRWHPDRGVGIDIVQRVYGAAKAGGAHQSMIVTTSFFTGPARNEQKRISTELQLADFETLKTWLKTYR
jgi:restriction system protein